MQVPGVRITFGEEDRKEIGRRIDEALRTGALTLGPNTMEFERAFAAALDVPFAVAVSSGTAALEIILRVIGVSGREVVIPTNTFAATGFAVQAAGGRPVFADVDATTLAVSVETVRPLLTEQTAALVLVHIGGLITPEIAELKAMCEQRGVALVEDAAHAHGSTYGGDSAGSFGLAGGFSFYPTKVITSGEGGMIVTADERFRDEALIYRDQGKAGFLGTQHIRRGYAWRMSELQATVGLVHLRRLGDILAVRRRVAARYDEGLRPIGGLEPIVPPMAARSNYYKYIVLLDKQIDRRALTTRMRDRGVSLSGAVYDTPLHRQPIFKHLATRPLPVAEDVCARHICLPVHSNMSDAEIEHVLRALTSAIGVSE